MSKIQPRHATGDSEPGKYELVSRVSNTTVDPGDTVTINLYITGYGKIDSSKLFFAPPPDVLFEEDKSYVNAGLSPVLADGSVLLSPGENKKNLSGDETIIGFVWGQGRLKLTNSNFILALGGIGVEKWKENTPLFDLTITADSKNETYQTPTISSESELAKSDDKEGGSPITVVFN